MLTFCFGKLWECKLPNPATCSVLPILVLPRLFVALWSSRWESDTNAWCSPNYNGNRFALKSSPYSPFVDLSWKGEYLCHSTCGVPAMHKWLDSNIPFPFPTPIHLCTWCGWGIKNHVDFMGLHHDFKPHSASCFICTSAETCDKILF